MQSPSAADEPGKAEHSSEQGYPFWLLVLLVTVPVGMVALLSIGTLGLHSFRTVRGSIRAAEARETLTAIGNAAMRSYARDGKVCPSASSAIPAQATSISGTSYLSTEAEWQTDAAIRSGFACLDFALGDSQHFQYSYEVTPSGFSAIARGDINGDGKTSKYELVGNIVNGKLKLAPHPIETDPLE
jgi:hypothetical protein